MSAALVFALFIEQSKAAFKIFLRHGPNALALAASAGFVSGSEVLSFSKAQGVLAAFGF